MVDNCSNCGRELEDDRVTLPNAEEEFCSKACFEEFIADSRWEQDKTNRIEH